MAVKKKEKGKIIANVGFFNVRRIPKFEGTGKTRKLVSSTIGLYVEKNQLKDGFKNLEEAVEFAKTAKYNKKTKKLIE